MATEEENDDDDNDDDDDETTPRLQPASRKMQFLDGNGVRTWIQQSACWGDTPISAYSNQLMEHLHPDDSLKQLQNVYRTLKPGGIYFCVTPNRLSGPHDISRTFDPVATGLHLKEYTVGEMDQIFKETGFLSTRIYVRFGEYFVFLPTCLFKFVEQLIEPLPHTMRKLLTFNRIVKFLLGVKIVGKK